MIDQNELKSHRAQYILPIGLYNRKVVLDDILFEPRDTRIPALSARTRVVGDDDLERVLPGPLPLDRGADDAGRPGRHLGGWTGPRGTPEPRLVRPIWSASSGTLPLPPWTPLPSTGSWRPWPAWSGPPAWTT